MANMIMMITAILSIMDVVIFYSKLRLSPSNMYVAEVFKPPHATDQNLNIRITSTLPNKRWWWKPEGFRYDILIANGFQKIAIAPIPVKIAAIIPRIRIATESSSHVLKGTNSLWRLNRASHTHTINQWSPKPNAVTVVAIKERPEGMVNVELARTMQLTVISSRNCPIC
jgi:hypothetical protein